MSEKISFISAYSLDPTHAGMSALFDLTTLFSSLGITELKYTRNEKIHASKYLRAVLKPFSISHAESHKAENSHLIILANTPAFLNIIRSLKPIKKTLKSISVVLLDGFNPVTMNGLGDDILDEIDHLFTPVDAIASVINAKARRVKYHQLALAVDTLSIANCNPIKSIDIYNFGRINDGVHRKLIHSYGSANAQRLYVHSTFSQPGLINQQEHRALHWRQLLRAKISFCFEASNVARFCGSSPVLYRWFEALAAGAIVLGTQPKDETAKDIIFWDANMIEVKADGSDTIAIVDEVLDNYHDYATISNTNRTMAIKHHDWRYRVQNIFDKLEIESPDSLSDQINQLKWLSDSISLN